MVLQKILGKDIAKYVKGHSGLIVATILFTSIASLFGVIPAYLLKPFIDQGMRSSGERVSWEIPWPLADENSALGFKLGTRVLLEDIPSDNLLIILTFLAFGAVLLKSLFTYLGGLCGAAFSTKVVNKIREALFNKFVTLHVGYYTNKRTGELVGRANADLTLMQSMIWEILVGLIEHPVTALAFFSYLLYMNYKMTILLILFVPVIALVVRKFGRKVKRHAERVQDANAQLSQRYHEGITCLRVIQGTAQEERESRRFSEEVQSLYKNIMNWNKWQLGLGPFMDAMVFLFVPGVLILSKVYFQHTLGEIVSMVFAFSRVYGPIKKLSLVNNNIKTLQGATGRVFGILKTHSEIEEGKEKRPFLGLKEKIQFKDVWFGYDKEAPVLKGIDLEIRAGEMVAIVGSTGAGKSTLLDLLPRFYDVNRGSILLDGINIREFSLRDLRRKIGFVNQDTILFNDTIANNIRYGAQNKGMEEVIRAAKLALAHDFIVAQPKGYETVIGDRGVALSGGQRQRLAIARALLLEPSILLLDEAASALDAESDQMIRETIEGLRGHLTIIMVAHRLSSILNADRIVVMEEGKILESGTKAELLNLNGRFKKLFDLQFTGV